jgi:hypothetical protein
LRRGIVSHLQRSVHLKPDGKSYRPSGSKKKMDHPFIDSPRPPKKRWIILSLTALGRQKKMKPSFFALPAQRYNGEL